jgi:hypothetical protein
LKNSEQPNPALKSWLDNVIVPALVREYVAELHNKSGIARTAEPGLESSLETVSLSEENS